MSGARSSPWWGWTCPDPSGRGSRNQSSLSGHPPQLLDVLLVALADHVVRIRLQVLGSARNMGIPLCNSRGTPGRAS